MKGLGVHKVIWRGAAPIKRWTKPHDGKAEQARRAKRIAQGQLTKSNGLVEG